MVGKCILHPSRGRVVVRRLPSETTTRQGVIIPDTAAEKPCRGEVLRVGAGVRDQSGHVVSPEVKPGDIVLFGKWSGTEVKLDEGCNDDYIIMQESDIMGIISTGVVSKGHK